MFCILQDQFIIIFKDCLSNVKCFYVSEREIDTYKSEAERKAKYYYESCMDTNKTIEKLGAEPLIKLIEVSTVYSHTDVVNYGN